MTAEKAAIPAVAIMTETFVDAADLMARVCGLPGYRFTVIEHPISSADDDGLARRAEVAADDIAAILTGV